MTTAKHKVKFSSGRRRARTTDTTEPARIPAARIPRVTKIMALAIRFDHLIKTGQVEDQAELASLGHVSRARLSQIMDLLLLAPDIQEAIIFATKGTVEIQEKQVQPISRLNSWVLQRIKWKRILESD